MSANGKERAFFEDNGYYVGRGLFPAAEVAEIRDHFMKLRAEGPKPGDAGGDPQKGPTDPLNQYARMINMHNWDAKSNVWQADQRFTKLAEKLIGDDVVLCQTMLYFKPPGAPRAGTAPGPPVHPAGAVHRRLAGPGRLR